MSAAQKAAIKRLHKSLSHMQPCLEMPIQYLERKRERVQRLIDKEKAKQPKRRKQPQMKLDLLMEFERLYPNEGTNTFDWTGLESLMHLEFYKAMLDDLSDPTCKYGSEKHRDLWTWIFGKDQRGEVPFSFDACCHYTGDDPAEARERLMPLFIRRKSEPFTHRLDEVALAEANGLTRERWLWAKRLYRFLADAIDEARTPAFR